MTTKQIAIIVIAVAYVLAAFSVPLGIAVEPAESSRPILDKLLKAIEVNDYDSFVADGNNSFKAGLTKQTFQRVSTLFSPRMKKGYDCSYLGELKQQGCRVHLWKIVFKDGGDDTLTKLVLKDSKVAGFFFQ